jgi:hypothetical protein
VVVATTTVWARFEAPPALLATFEVAPTPLVGFEAAPALIATFEATPAHWVGYEAPPALLVAFEATPTLLVAFEATPAAWVGFEATPALLAGFGATPTLVAGLEAIRAAPWPADILSCMHFFFCRPRAPTPAAVSRADALILFIAHSSDCTAAICFIIMQYPRSSPMKGLTIFEKPLHILL